MSATKFLTIKQAAQYVGKSEKTIQRLVSELKSSSNEALKKELTKTGNKFKYLIATDYLQKRYSLKISDSQSIQQRVEPTGNQQAIEALTKQLTIKDNQIKELSERLKESSKVNSQLVERISEGNKLQANLQLEVQKLNSRLLMPPVSSELPQVQQQEIEEIKEQYQHNDKIQQQLEQLKKQRLIYGLMVGICVLLLGLTLLFIDYV